MKDAIISSAMEWIALNIGSSIKKLKTQRKVEYKDNNNCNASQDKHVNDI